MGNRVAQCCAKCFGRQKGNADSRLELMAPGNPEAVPLSTGEKSFEHPTITVELATIVEEPHSAPYDIQAIEEALNAAKESVISVVSEEGWEVLVKKDDVSVSGKVGDRGYFMRTEWSTVVGKEKFMKFVKKYEHRPSWDLNLAESRVIAHLPHSIDITYQRFKKVLTVSPRDLVLACKSYTVGQALLEVTTSIDTNQCPVIDSVIRAQVFMGGFWAETTEKGSTRVVAVTEINFGGAVPRAVMLRMSATAMPAYFKGLHSALIEDD